MLIYQQKEEPSKILLETVKILFHARHPIQRVAWYMEYVILRENSQKFAHCFQWTWLTYSPDGVKKVQKLLAANGPPKKVEIWCISWRGWAQKRLQATAIVQSADR